MIKRLAIKNFKSYRDAEFEFGKVNVVVGPNGSGKTNLVDAFSFLKQLIRPLSYPPYPFIRWGDYKNVIFMQDENLDISFEINGTYKSKDYHYEVSLNNLQIKKEIINFASHTIERENNVIRYENKEVTISQNLSVFNLFVSQIIPNITIIYNLNFPLPGEFIDFMTNFLNDIGVFRIVPQIAVSPVHFTFPEAVDENGRGLVKVIANNLTKIIESENMKPLHDFLNENNISLRPVFTEDGNIRLYFVEKSENRELILPPSSVSDGFIKMLTILVAVYLLGLSTIVIDEIENSLHLRYIENLIDVMRYSNTQFIMTTHSPLIIDFMDPSEIIILDKEKGETKVSKINEPNKLKEKLVNDGILLSEWILY
ncbi:AAA family ATPase [Sulfurisphaera tokodaii]|nr:ATP/GTP-binding protein [Sulfurisphaera tokodaii]HII73194.1 AAA family ATPase [Sulfurisphaera tokodaii]